MIRLLSLTTLILVGSAHAGEKPIDFNRDVRPILSNKCFACHGPDAKERKGDLRIDDEKEVKEDRGGYHVVDVANPEKGELWYRIVEATGKEKMPPPRFNKDLTAKETAILKRWMTEGASWSKHWAYVPPTEHPVPTVNDASWNKNWIDSFLQARFEQEGLHHSPETDKATLLRRLSFDLVGLPPTKTELDAFLADSSPSAYENQVNRLLASPHFGERMAIYWLDLVRFADTVGYHGDQPHNSTPYRDYVINAFNQNMKFDQFTKEQLAGDLLQGSTDDQKTASCYNRLLQTTHEGGLQVKEYLAIYTADRVRNVSTVWMGATVGCAQCHDHKFDPITAKDFYSLGAFFADIDDEYHLKHGKNGLPTIREPEMLVHTRMQRDQLQEMELELKKLHDDKDADPALIVELKESIDELLKAKRAVMISKSVKPREMRVLPRGNWMDDSGPIVQPAVPESFGGAKPDRPLNRLDLANWLVDTKDGSGLLTARVMANRFWYLYFGVGLSSSLSDFGGQGEPPVYPELLDNLSVAFAKNWDVKELTKLIVMSQAYRQTSQVSAELQERDPENRLFARQSRYRFPAEMVRDNALSVSGLLVETIGGPSVMPYQPPGYYRHLNFPEREYKPDMVSEKQWRRGIYVHWQRQFLHPMMKAFDAPSREECTAERPRSNTPLAALVVLNDPTFVEASRAFAERTLKSVGDDSTRLEFAFQLATSRKPDALETQVLLHFLDESRTTYSSDDAITNELLGVGIEKVPSDFDKHELAAWTNVCRAILNLNETMTRN